MLSDFGCPTLVVRGDEDGITTADHQRQLTDTISQAINVGLADCGHAIPLEAPERAGQLISDWLKGL